MNTYSQSFFSLLLQTEILSGTCRTFRFGRNYFMRTSIFQLVAILAIIFGSSTTASAQFFQVGPSTISKLTTVWGDDGLIVTLSSGTFTTNGFNGCGVNTEAIVPANPLSPSYKILTSTLMAAFLSGKQVTLSFQKPDAATPYPCSISRIIITGVDVLN
jgi:hypothetical protein